MTFLSLIAPRITANQVAITFAMKMNHLDENQVTSVNQLLQLCREKIATISSIFFIRCLSNIQFLPDVDNKMKIINCYGIEESTIPILMHFLASPRADGQQRVMKMYFGAPEELPMAQKLLDAVKEVGKKFIWHVPQSVFYVLQEFRISTQPVPQPFYICCFYCPQNLNIPQSEEENPQTNETLTIMPNPRE
jgi:hypothetical protein